MLKAALDTNVLISAICFPGGSPDLVFKAALRKQYEMFISSFILAEFSRILAKKFHFSSEETEKAVTLLRNTASQVIKPSVIPALITTKPADNHVLACAIEGKVNYLVTGDTRHIQPLGSIGEIKIVSPGEFLRILTMGYY